MSKVKECLILGKSLGFTKVWQAILEYERHYLVFFSMDNIEEEVSEFKAELINKSISDEMGIEEALSKYGET